MSSRLRSMRHWRTPAAEGLRMVLLTGASFVLGLALTAGLVESVGLHPTAAYTVALVICSTINFFGCRYFVFRTGASQMLPEAVKFIASILLFRVAEVALFQVLLTWSNDYRVAYIATATISIVGKFVVARVFIFKSRSKERSP